MRTLVSGCLVASLLAVSAPAHAMGVYVNFSVIAWNADGSSALLTRDGSSSATAGATHDYILVSASDRTPVVFTFSDTQDPDAATEHVDHDACVKAAGALAKALTAKHFKGVTVKADHCTATRDVVAVSADAAKAAAAAKVTPPFKRGKTPRDATSYAAAQAAFGSGAPSDGTDDEIAAASGVMAIVLSGENGDSSRPAHVAVYVPSKSGTSADRWIEDLRDVR